MLVEDTENSRRKRTLLNVRQLFPNATANTTSGVGFIFNNVDSRLDIDTTSVLSYTTINGFPGPVTSRSAAIITVPFSGLYQVTVTATLLQPAFTSIYPELMVGVTTNFTNNLADFNPSSSNNKLVFVTSYDTGTNYNGTRAPILISTGVGELVAGSVLLPYVQHAFFTLDQFTTLDINLTEITQYTDRGTT